MRLDKFLAHHLEISRSLVTKVLKMGRIMVNDNVVKLGAYQLQTDDAVFFDGRLIEPLSSQRYFMVHKPQGYVCSNEEGFYPSVTTLVETLRADRLHAAGRLDVDTTGLVLLTDDGQWSHRITAPKKKCQKVYLVTVAEPLTPAIVDHFAAGIALRNEPQKTAPAQLDILDDTTARVTLSEGKYHQIKRMFAAENNQVVALHREAIGPIQLDIPEGAFRALTSEEVALF